MTNSITVWQMVKEAIDALEGQATYSDIKNYIHQNYDDVNENTINAQIIVSTVNHPSRIHYPENNKPRISDSRYDFLYTVGRGKVVSFDQEEHGIWEIRHNEFGKLIISQVFDEEIDHVDSFENDASTFALENHLRDFLKNNLDKLKILDSTLQLYKDEDGRDGVEFPTEAGIIDILAIDQNSIPVVFELKVGKGPDRTVGQILRYMGWVKQNLPNGENVYGIIVASKMNDKLKYAASMVSQIYLYEYSIDFNISKIE